MILYKMHSLLRPLYYYVLLSVMVEHVYSHKDSLKLLHACMGHLNFLECAIVTAVAIQMCSLCGTSS